MSNKDYILTTLKYLSIYLVIGFSIFAFLKDILPEYGFFFSRDEYGEMQDLRLTFASLFAIPITIFLVLGYKSWKNKWNESDYLIKFINERYDIVNKLGSEIKKTENVLGKYEKEKLLEKIKQAIERNQKNN